jgi:hypothetical protein
MAALKPANAAFKKFSGSCLRLHRGSQVVGPSSRIFAVNARETCTSAILGGRLASFNSLDPGTTNNGILSVIKTLIAGANSNLVLLGGVQSTLPDAKGDGTKRNQKWIWWDAYTNPAIIATGNWAPGQPE